MRCSAGRPVDHIYHGRLGIVSGDLCRVSPMNRHPSPDALDALCAELAAARADAEFLRGTVLRICALLPDAADMLAGDAFDKDKRRVVARRVMADCLNRVHDEVAEAIAVQRARVAGVQS